MPSENREKLRSFFKNNSQLSEAHFAALINAMLDRKDDQFHGLWRPGQVYQPGDVVIYQRQLWEMNSTEEICAKPGESPSETESVWRSFLDDNDWAVVTEEKVMWAKVFDKVGIGVGSNKGDRPQAQLDIRKNILEATVEAITESLPDNPGAGRWLLFPEQATQTQQTFLHFSTPSQTSTLITGLSLEAATWSSNATHGFAFRHNDNALDESSALLGQATDGDVMLALHPTQSQAQAPKFASLGLNVENPTALLDITDRHRSQFLVLPKARSEPTLTLINLLPQNVAPTYFALAVNHTETSWGTNARAGFSFRFYADRVDGADGIENGEESVSAEVDATSLQGNQLMRIRQHPDGQYPQVGIGIDSPAAYLDIQDLNYNRIQLLPVQGSDSNSATNPAIAMINNQASSLGGDRNTYFTLGIQPTQSILITDATEGFTFKARKLTDSGNHHLNLDRGQLLVNISPDGNGRLGVGKKPSDYELEVQGMASAYTFYQASDPSWINNEVLLTDVLGKLNSLHPVTFQWHDSTGFQAHGEQIGLRIAEVNEVFPQVITTAQDGTPAIAYQNLVPVLIQALNELAHQNQQEHIQLEQKIALLNDRNTVLAIWLVVGWAIALLGYWI